MLTIFQRKIKYIFTHISNKNWLIVVNIYIFTTISLDRQPEPLLEFHKAMYTLRRKLTIKVVLLQPFDVKKSFQVMLNHQARKCNIQIESESTSDNQITKLRVV